MVDLPHAGPQQQPEDKRNPQLSGQHVVVDAFQVRCFYILHVAFFLPLIFKLVPIYQFGIICLTRRIFHDYAQSFIMFVRFPDCKIVCVSLRHVKLKRGFAVSPG